MKYTKGKWEVRPVNAEVLPHHVPLNGIYQGGILIATTGNHNHIGSEDTTNLIAAAPELYEIVKYAVNLCYFAGAPDFMKKAKQALAKAEGNINEKASS